MPFSERFAASVALCLLAGVGAATAGDLGAIGPTTVIEEPDMLEWIEKRVADKVHSGEALRYQQQQTEKIKQKLTHPEPLKSVSRAMKNRTIFFDPTFVVEENVLDDKGQILVAAGATINPLDRVGLSRPLLFFDAHDPSQVAFAKKYMTKHDGLPKPILVGGSYFELMKRWKTAVYFDQQSALIRKFGIRAVPAIVFQEGRRLRIDEIAL